VCPAFQSHFRIIAWGNHLEWSLIHTEMIH
jgi:hypothetical protein